MAAPILLGKKKNYRLTYTIKKVTIKEDSSVGKYRKINADDLDDVIKGLKDKSLWQCQFTFDEKAEEPKTVSGLTFPDVSGHKSHVETGGWKYYIDKGRGSEDRLVVSAWSADIKNCKNNGPGKAKGMTELSCDVEISCTVKAFADTHS